MVNGLLGATLGVLHSLLWLRESVSWAVIRLWVSIVHSIKHKGTKLECIESDVKTFQKRPYHLAVIVQEKEISCDNLAQVTAWAFASGVRIVSLYDPIGELITILKPA